MVPFTPVIVNVATSPWRIHCSKTHVSGWSDIKQWKTQAVSLSCYRVTLVWRNKAGKQAGSYSSYLVSQSVENSIEKLKFHGNILKAIPVNLKACLGLVLANQYCSIVVRKTEAGFRVILLHGPHLLFGCPYYEPLLPFMIFSSLITYIQLNKYILLHRFTY